MNRCLKTCPAAIAMALASLVLPGLATLPLEASAQGTVRTFPDKALRGKLVVTQAPEVLLDGKPDRLSPGARIRGTDHLMMTSARLTGQPYAVNYLRDGHGLIHEVWILTPAEAALKRPASNP